MIIELFPTPMSPEVMADLEKRGLIIRICPGNHSLNPEKNESLSAPIYVSDPRNGPHKLIVVTINALEPHRYFGTHVDNEEFLLLGDPASKPVYFIVATCKRDGLEEKIKNRKLSANDFVALQLKLNDPQVSFFTMLADVAHGEVTIDGPGVPASFYVTEPNDLTIDQIDFGDYQLAVRTG